jgi:FAD/FMN-containing dehydrogenase
MGGAVANDIHGKNHHVAGTFGCHLDGFELARSDGTTHWCTPTQNRELFCATVGGLGLTGVILQVSLSLRPMRGRLLEKETVPFVTLEQFVRLSEQSETEWEYSVAWFDFFSFDGQSLRGLFYRARPVEEAHLSGDRRVGSATSRDARLSFPFEAPEWLLSEVLLRGFNRYYFSRGTRESGIRRVDFERFHFPLDRIAHWNRMYGKRGFRQLQCVVPYGCAIEALGRLLRVLADAKMGSFLAVLKRFGSVASPGMLSFPMPGYTLALDIPNRGTPTDALFRNCHRVVAEYGGRIYAAKDSSMSAEDFACGYPTWREFASYVDPRFSSGLWRRTGHRLLRGSA